MYTVMCAQNKRKFPTITMPYGFLRVSMNEILTFEFFTANVRRNLQVSAA